MAKKKIKRTLKTKKKEVYPKKLYDAYVRFLSIKDEDVAEKYYENVYKPLQEKFLGDKASDRMEQSKLAQRLSAIKLKRKD